MYYAIIKNNAIVGIGQCKVSGEDIICVKISQDIYENIEKYKYSNQEIIAKSDEEYKKELSEQKETQFNSEFFKTSLGFIRRKVTMSTGETKDFLSDLLPVISLGVQSGQEVTIITYNEPDFTQDLTTEYMESLQKSKTVTSDFIQECFVQLSNDFLG